MNQTNNSAMETKKSLLKAEEIFFDYLDIKEYPKHKIILNSSDIVQMIANGIVSALAIETNINLTREAKYY